VTGCRHFPDIVTSDEILNHVLEDRQQEFCLSRITLEEVFY